VFSVAVPTSEWIDLLLCYWNIPSSGYGCGSRSNFVSDNRTSITEPILIVASTEPVSSNFCCYPSGSGLTSPSGTNVWETAVHLASLLHKCRYSFFLGLVTAGTVANTGLASTSVTISGSGTITANLHSVRSLCL